MAGYPIPSKSVKAAMDAHKNLAIYEAVVALLEGGTLSGNVGGTPAKLIAACKKEQQRQLKLMDAAVAAVNRAAAQGAGE